MPRPVLLGIFALLCATHGALADPKPSAACKEWMDSVQWYSLELDRAIGGGEATDPYSELEQALASTPEDLVSLLELGARCKKAIVYASTMAPPEELTTLHHYFLDYMRSTANAAELLVSDAEADRPSALLSVLSDLLLWFDRLMADFHEQGCDTGDMEAIRERILPELRARQSELQALAPVK